MKALIIGAAGFVGGYLAEHLQKEYGWSVSVTKLEHETFFIEEAAVYDLDILDEKAVQQLLFQIEPDYIFHLAAQSSVALSWKNPDLTIDVNIKGCIHVLEAVRKLKKQPRILLVGSGEEYGIQNIYAATKACQNMLGTIYAKAYQMEIVLVRAFNHIGPKQSSVFVVSDFCRQAAEIEAGKREPVLWVGNLEIKRDFTDVRDIVRAYGMLIQKGKAGENYNVGSGRAVAIQEILEKILSLSKKKIRIETDPKKLRPLDLSVIEADIQKLQEVTGWKPQISLEDTIRDILEDWREKQR